MASTRHRYPWADLEPCSFGNPWRQNMVPTLVSTMRRLAALLLVSLLALTSIAPPVSADGRGSDDKDRNQTETPIKHVIVLIGENRTFDHVFATYVSRSKDSISNLLSKGII